VQEIIKKLNAWYDDTKVPCAPTTQCPEIIEAVHWTYRTKSIVPLAHQRLTVPGSYDRSARPSWIGLSGYYTNAKFEWAPLSTAGEALVGGMTANSHEYAINIKHKNLTTKKRWKIHEDNKVIVIGGNENYYHFVLDILPRLLSVYYSGLLKSGWRVALCNDKANLIGQSVQILGLTNENIIWLDDDFDHWFFRAIYITNANIEGSVHPLTNLLLARFKDRIQEPVINDRIFISRSGINRRRLINEKLLIKSLKRRSFSILRPEELSLEQQIMAFRGARVVVGVHGAGLTNLIWCDNPRVLIELSGSKPSTPFGIPDLHFKNMVSGMNGCSYRRLRAEIKNTAQPGDHQSDFFIDSRRILEEIDQK
jgi:capsular polysaccharide biosynthesis protein